MPYFSDLKVLPGAGWKFVLEAIWQEGQNGQCLNVAPKKE